MIKHLTRFFALFATLLGITFGALNFTATPAHANDDIQYYGYNVDVNEACWFKYGGEQYLISSNVKNVSNPYTWYCQKDSSNSTTVGISAGRSNVEVNAESSSSSEILGGIDMQLFCSRKYPGTIAYVSDYYAPWWNAFNWRCR